MKKQKTKRLLTVLTLALILVSIDMNLLNLVAYGEDSNLYETIIFDQKFDIMGFFPVDLAPVEINDKCGYIDTTTGKIVIEPKFDDAAVFFGDIASIKINDQWEYINKTGEIITPPEYDCLYQGIDDDIGPLFIRQINGSSKILMAVRSRKNEKVGYIDKTGKLVIEPQFDNAGFFLEDLTPVEINGKWGYIDKQGTIVIKPKFDYAYFFSEGLAHIVINEKWGYIDKTGNIVIEPKFDYSSSFSDGLAEVEIEDHRYGYIDKTGNWIINIGFKEIHLPYEDKYGNTIKEEILLHNAMEGYFFTEGLALVCIDGKYGYIDKTGKIIIEPIFDNAFYFSEGLAPIVINEKGGYIDKTGNIVIEPKFDCLGLFFRGVAPVLIDKEKGISGIIRKKNISNENKSMKNSN